MKAEGRRQKKGKTIASLPLLPSSFCLLPSLRPLTPALSPGTGEREEASMKVSIIGGGGRVGSNAAFAFQCAAIVSEIHLLDANEQMAAGEALDLIHGASVAGDQKIYAGNYEKCGDSDVVCITAGLRRKPDESRLDLINRNVTLFKQVLDSLREAKLKKDAIVIVVSNPVD